MPGNSNTSYQTNKANANCAVNPPRSYMLQPSLNIENLPPRFRGAKCLPMQFIPPMPMCGQQPCCPPGCPPGCPPSCFPQPSCCQPQCPPPNPFCGPPCPPNPYCQPPCPPPCAPPCPPPQQQPCYPMPPPYCSPYPCYPYPPPCCMPYPPCPPPCCPPPCCPPPDPCNNPAQMNPPPKPKCGGKIICVPKGQRPPQLGGGGMAGQQTQNNSSPIPGFSSKDNPASFNNCNFYVSELPSGFNNQNRMGGIPQANPPMSTANNDMMSFAPDLDDCIPEDPDPYYGKNNAAGDDQIVPPPVGYPGATRKIWGSIDENGVPIVQQRQPPPRQAKAPVKPNNNNKNKVNNNRMEDSRDNSRQASAQPQALPKNIKHPCKPVPPVKVKHPCKPEPIEEIQTDIMPSSEPEPEPEPTAKQPSKTPTKQNTREPSIKTTVNPSFANTTRDNNSNEDRYQSDLINRFNKDRGEKQADYCIPQDYDKPPKVCKPVVWRRKHPCCMPEKAQRLKTLCQRCHNRFAQNMLNCGLPMPEPPRRANPISHEVYTATTAVARKSSSSSASSTQVSTAIETHVTATPTTFRTNTAVTTRQSKHKPHPRKDSVENLYNANVNVNFTSSHTIANPQPRQCQPRPNFQTCVRHTQSAPHMCRDTTTGRGQNPYATGIRSETAISHTSHFGPHGGRTRTTVDVGVAAFHPGEKENCRPPQMEPHFEKSKIKRIIIQKNPFDQTRHITVIKDRKQQILQPQADMITNPNFYGAEPSANCNYSVFNVQQSPTDFQNAMKQIPQVQDQQQQPQRQQQPQQMFQNMNPLGTQRVMGNCDPGEMKELNEILQMIQTVEERNRRPQPPTQYCTAMPPKNECSPARTPQNECCTVRTPQNECCTVRTPQNECCTVRTPRNELRTPQNELRTPQNECCTVRTPRNELRTPQNELRTPRNELRTPQNECCTVRTPRNECRTVRPQNDTNCYPGPSTKHVQVRLPDNNSEEFQHTTRYYQDEYPILQPVPQSSQYQQQQEHHIKFPRRPKLCVPPIQNCQQKCYGQQQQQQQPRRCSPVPISDNCSRSTIMKVAPQREYEVYNNPTNVADRKIEITNLIRGHGIEHDVQVSHHEVSTNRNTTFAVKPHESYSLKTNPMNAHNKEAFFSVSSSHLPMDLKPFHHHHSVSRTNIRSNHHQQFQGQRTGYHTPAPAPFSKLSDRPAPAAAPRPLTNTKIEITDKGKFGKEIKITSSVDLTRGNDDRRNKGGNQNGKGHDDKGNEWRKNDKNPNKQTPPPPPPATNTYRPNNDKGGKNNGDDGNYGKREEACGPTYKCWPVKNCKSPRMITCRGQKPIFSLFPPACPIRETNASIWAKKPPAHCSKHNQDATPFPDYCMIRQPHHDETFKHKLQFVDHCADGNDGTRVDNEIPVQYKKTAQLVKQGVKRRLHQ